MNDRQQDADLRAHFEAQRRTDRDAAPPFAEVMARARDEAAVRPIATGRRRLLGLVSAGGLAAAAVIAALLAVPRQQSSERDFEQTIRAFQNDPASGAWRSPTDGLLNVPGSQLISTVPSFGTGQ